MHVYHAHSCKRGVGRWHYTLDCATWWGSSWTRKNGSWSTWMTQQAVDPQIGSSIYTWWICGWCIVHCHRWSWRDSWDQASTLNNTSSPPPHPPALATQGGGAWLSDEFVYTCKLTYTVQSSPVLQMLGNFIIYVYIPFLYILCYHGILFTCITTYIQCSYAFILFIQNYNYTFNECIIITLLQKITQCQFPVSMYACMLAWNVCLCLSLPLCVCVCVCGVCVCEVRNVSHRHRAPSFLLALANSIIACTIR